MFTNFISGALIGSVLAFILFVPVLINRHIPHRKGHEFSKADTIRSLSANADIINKAVPDHATEEIAGGDEDVQ